MGSRGRPGSFREAPVRGLGSQDLPDLFQEALLQLQLLHESRVSHLTSEVARLRAELESCGGQAAFSLAVPAEIMQEAGSAGGALGPVGRQQQEPKAVHTMPEGAMVTLMEFKRGKSESKRSSWTSSVSDLRMMEAQEAQHPRTSKRARSRGQSTSQAQGAVGQRSSFKGRRGPCQRIVENNLIDMVFGIVITANAICIGIESSYSRVGQRTPLALNALEYIFLGLYVVELAMRFGAQGIIRALDSNWIKFDFVLVCLGLVDVAVKIATMGGTIEILDKVFLVRLLRLARLVRVFRLIAKFNTLRMLVQGLLNSIPSLVWTATVVCTLLYMFAVLGLELLQPDPAMGAEYNEVVATHFSDLTSTMLLLFQGFTDGFSAIYKPVVIARPVTILYFASFVLIMPITLMSLVTALMVKLSLNQADKDKQQQGKQKQDKKVAMVDLLKQMFRELDVDGSGRIDVVEMLNAPPELRCLIFEIAEIAHHPGDDAGHLIQILEVLDFDGSGDVEVNEFCDGLVKLQDGQALAMARIMKQCEQMMDMLKTMTGKASYRATYAERRVSQTPSIQLSFEHEHEYASQPPDPQDVQEGRVRAALPCSL